MFLWTEDRVGLASGPKVWPGLCGVNPGGCQGCFCPLQALG